CGDLGISQPFAAQGEHRGDSLLALTSPLLAPRGGSLLAVSGVRGVSSLVTARVAVQATGGNLGWAGAAHSRLGDPGSVAHVHARMTTTALGAALAFASPLVTVALVGGRPK